MISDSHPVENPDASKTGHPVFEGATLTPQPEVMAKV